jgi:hypothetical protein
MCEDSIECFIWHITKAGEMTDFFCVCVVLYSEPAALAIFFFFGKKI